jgi:hypothetical protein
MALFWRGKSRENEKNTFQYYISQQFSEQLHQSTENFQFVQFSFITKK